MIPSLDNWPKQHKYLAFISLGLAILVLAIAIIRLRPRWNLYTETRDEKLAIEEKLLKSEWPKDSERLNALLRDYQKKLNKDSGNKTNMGLIEETQKTLEQATSLFKQNIINEYGSITEFIQKASQTEYKYQYDRLDTYLQGKNITLDVSVFGLDEQCSDPLKYQMLLKLWTTRAIVDCALQAKLRVTTQKGPRGRPVSNIKVLPMKAYYLNPEDPTPYLLEFPIECTLSGTLQSFATFVDSLYSKKRFLPLTQLEIINNPPNLKNPPKPNEKGALIIRNITAKVICSSFFLPDEKSQKNIQIKSQGTTEISDRPAGI